MWTIELSDGTRYEGLGQNGNNFTSKQELTAEMFPAQKLGHVKFIETIEPEEDGGEVSESIEEHGRMKVIAVGYDSEWECWRVVLADQTESERENIQLRSDIAYVAMMAGVEL